MHPLVRKLYKEAIYVGRDYPLSLDKVRTEGKKAIRNSKNCPSCYNFVRSAKDDGNNRIGNSTASDENGDDELTVAVPKRMHCEEYPNPDCERELRKAVGKGRYMIREMIGVIQLKKYRSLKRRYGDSDYSDVAMLREKLEALQKKEDKAILETRDDNSKEDI